jgi:hypothetical protein
MVTCSRRPIMATRFHHDLSRRVIRHQIAVTETYCRLEKDKTPSNVFSDDTPTLSCHRPGALMVRNAPSKKFSTMADDIESSPSPHAIEESTMPKPSIISDLFTDLDTSEQTPLFVQKPFWDGSTPNVGLMQHRRNKTTISDSFNIADSKAVPVRTVFA